ncbi:hypothetical protein YC2023_012586 [Brassica napus]
MMNEVDWQSSGDVSLSLSKEAVTTRVAILDDEGARVTRASPLRHLSTSPEIHPSDLTTKPELRSST